LGCGPGILWKQNLDRISSGIIVLSDFSAGMLRDCWQNLGAHVSRFRFCQLDATTLPFRDQSVDAVVANMMLYHVENRPGALRDIRRVLRPGGALYATTTGRKYMRELQETTNRILGVPPRATSAERFGLETGYEQLAAVFACVKIIRYENSLRVTEIQPLMDYFLSMTPFISAPAERWSALRQHFEGIITTRGEIYIPTDMGMLIARD
jgi:SAM-dependent methyltransferase